MSCVKLDRNGAVATLTLNRPESMNALGLEGDGDAFTEICAAINADSTVRCVILTGAGRAFSAGGDIKAMLEKRGGFAGSPVQLRGNYRKGIHLIIHALRGIEVPVIAAVNGPAIGLGNDLLTTADIRIAADTARFGATFINIGLVPGDGGAWMLPRVIGASRAAELFYTGDLIDADTAAAWGLVSRVVPAATLMDEAGVLAEKIAAKPPLPVRMTKRMMREAETASLDSVMEMAAAMQATLHGTEDHRRALTAILEKTEASYTGE